MPTLRDVDEPTPTLDRLLDAELAYDTDARGGFTSHLAMGLVAATRLGADASTLERWFQAEVDEGYLLTRPDRPAWLTEGIDRVDRHGIDAEVRAALGDLVDRTGGLFHWLIRLELAIDARHAGQVANAIGDWHRRPRRDRSALPDPTGERRVTDVLEELWSGGGPDGAGLDSEARRHLVTEVADHPELLDEIALAVAELHWSADDFTTLHMVTGTRAARALVPYLHEPDRRRLAHAHLHAVASALTRVSRPGPDPDPIPDPPALPRWEAIGAAAIATGDDHVVKLTYASRLEEAATGHSLYRAITARATGQLTS